MMDDALWPPLLAALSKERLKIKFRQKMSFYINLGLHVSYNQKSPHYKLFGQTKSFAWTPGGAGGRWKIVRLMPLVRAKLNHI